MDIELNSISMVVTTGALIEALFLTWFMIKALIKVKE
jgi:hypothetical protein